jgi:hypothetical protein
VFTSSFLCRIVGLEGITEGTYQLPADFTPRMLFKQPFLLTSLAKHIKPLAKMLGGRKPKEASLLEEGVVGAGASGAAAGDGLEAVRPLDKTLGFKDNFAFKYKLEREIGRGQLAHVFLAIVKSGRYKGQNVAVKIISKAKVKEPQYMLISNF